MAGPSTTTRSQAKANHATENTEVAMEIAHDGSSISRPKTRKTSVTGKENGLPVSATTMVPKSKGKAKVASGNTARKGANSQVKIKEEFCLCKGPDDGTPMVQCSCCRDWYVSFRAPFSS